MRHILFFFLVLALYSCKEKKSSDPLTNHIDLQNAKSDFRLFRDILEEAHPSLTDYISSNRKSFLFDSVYKTIDKKISTRNFYKKLAFIINEIGCSHTYTSLPRDIIDTLYNRPLFFPFPTILLDAGLFINADHDLPHGTKVLSINGIPIKRILDSLMMYNTVEGYRRETQRYATSRDFGYDYFIHFGTPEKFELLLKDTTGKIKTAFYNPVTLDELNTRKSERYYYDVTDVPYSLSINDEFHYAKIRLPSFEIGSASQQQAFENFLENSFELLSKKKEIGHLIIDLRENGGGDLYYCFLFHSYLCKNPFAEYSSVFSRIKKIPYTEYLSASIQSSLLDNIRTRLKNDFLSRVGNGYSVPDSLIDIWVSQRHQFMGKVYIIINDKVASAASQFAQFTKKNGNARLVGTETTGGAYSGNGLKALAYRLPFSKIGFEFPYAKLTYSFHDEKTGRGLVPDYLVPDDYRSFIANEDRQLTFIIDSLILKNR